MKAFRNFLKNNPVRTNAHLSLAVASGLASGVHAVASKRKAELKATEAGRKASEAKQVFKSEIQRLTGKGAVSLKDVASEVKADLLLILEEATKKVAAAQTATDVSEEQLAAKNAILNDFYEDIQNLVKASYLGSSVVRNTDPEDGEGVTSEELLSKDIFTEFITEVLKNEPKTLIIGEVREASAVADEPKKPIVKKTPTPRVKKVAVEGVTPVVKKAPAVRKPTAKKPAAEKPKTSEDTDKV